MADSNSSDTNANFGLAVLGLMLALGLLGSTWIASRAVLEARQENRALEVKGFAEKNITSDLAEWQGSFTTRDADLQAGYAKLERDRKQVIAFLASKGLGADGYELHPVYTSPFFARDARGVTTNQIEGYALTQRVSLSSTDIELVSAISKESPDLVKQGVEFSSNSPEYLYTRLGDLKISMLGEASADARRRADVLASESGGSIGTLLSARQGVFQITPAHSTEVSDYGRNDTSSRDKTIKAVVTMSYAVER